MTKLSASDCPAAHAYSKSDIPDSEVKTKNNDQLPNICPAHWHKIPSTGRGNSEDGEAWENPSPRQLYSALKRKNKAGDLEEEGAIDVDIVKSVANAHATCTKKAWDAVLEFENLHKSSCSKPTLARFNGNPEYTIKARFWQLLGYELPFDRHDWYVNRCGKEIKYIIDFYSSPRDEAEMIIDARPSITVHGVVDRVHLAARKGLSSVFSLFSSSSSSSSSSS
eukprot:TRINITY_DN486_c0_g1_i2.p1 TRINITY_DN486_c0_g1~~TRINITY_DN486_c0_g1_i2.p1  ORF type:complete len:223 (-),score=36.69 TRINITY_DN486_c0_g1_i2:36-704(-)